MRLFNLFGIVFSFWMIMVDLPSFVDTTVSSAASYHHDTMKDDTTCAVTENVFSLTTSSVIHCSACCHVHARCRSFTYSSGSGGCYGCRDQYSISDGLDADGGTKYYTNLVADENLSFTSEITKNTPTSTSEISTTTTTLEVPTSSTSMTTTSEVTTATTTTTTTSAIPTTTTTSKVPISTTTMKTSEVPTSTTTTTTSKVPISTTTTTTSEVPISTTIMTTSEVPISTTTTTTSEVPTPTTSTATSKIPPSTTTITTTSKTPPSTTTITTTSKIPPSTTTTTKVPTSTTITTTSKIPPSTTTISTIQTSTTANGLGDWKYFEGSYYMYVSTYMTGDEAEHHCKEHPPPNGVSGRAAIHLAVTETEAENSFVEDLAFSGTGDQESSPSSIFLGMDYSPMFGVSGSNSDFTNWAALPENDGCVLMESDGKWILGDCFTFKAHFVCELNTQN